MKQKLKQGLHRLQSYFQNGNEINVIFICMVLILGFVFLVLEILEWMNK